MALRLVGLVVLFAVTCAAAGCKYSHVMVPTTQTEARSCAQSCAEWTRSSGNSYQYRRCLANCPGAVNGAGKCQAQQPETEAVCATDSGQLKTWAGVLLDIGLVVFLSGTLVLGAVYGAADTINEGIGTDR